MVSFVHFAVEAIVRTCRVPCGEDNAPVCRVLLDLSNDFCELVDALSRVVVSRRFVLCAKVPPLEAVDWAEVALFPVGEAELVEEGARAVAVPDVHAFFLQRL